MTKRTRRRPHCKVDYDLGMCHMCKGLHDFDDDGNSEKLLTCFDCHRNVHAKCYQLGKTTVEIIQTYDWQCNDCKSCLVCQSKNNEKKIVICNRCDRGYHTFCCNPSLKAIPRDDWYCNLCSSMPSPLPSPKIPPLTQDKQNNSNSNYRLRPSPPHSAKFIESMATSTTATAPSPSAMMTRQSKTKIGPIKITLNLKEANMNKLTTSDAPPRKRGRPPSKKRKRSLSPALPPPSPSDEEPVDDLGEEKEAIAVEKEKDKAKQTEEELFFKTFGHKLTEKQASIKKGTPNELDRLKFEKAKLKAEKKLLIQQQQEERQLKKQQKQPQRHHTRHSSTSSNHNNSPYPTFEPPKIRKIYFNHYIIDTWYVAPYPEEYSQNSTLYICEFCMKYMKSPFIAQRHTSKCKVRHPPGDEIYRDGAISIFEVDGRKNKMYCQNLCLLAKLFLDHKTLYYDVEPFLFYVMTETSTTTTKRIVKKDGREEEQEQELDDGTGCHFVGYFSKEKRSSMNYNVSCILTLPVFQRKGYGQFLIDFSYLLSKRENKTGTPERPLSDLGLLSYQSYWKNVIYRELIQQKEGQQISIDELSHRTSLTPEDIISTLRKNNMIQYNAKGKHSISVNVDEMKAHLDKLGKKNYLKLDPEKLTWTPFVLSRDRLAALLASSSPSNRRSDEDAAANTLTKEIDEEIDITT